MKMKFHIAKYALSLLLFLILVDWANAQVVNRYPNIQRPSQTKATIAWRRAANSTGILYLGNSPGVWFDSISTVGLEKKHFFDLAGLQVETQYYYQVKSIAPGDTFVSAIEMFYTAPYETILVPLESWHSQLSIGAIFMSQRSILLHFMAMFRILCNFGRILVHF